MWSECVPFSTNQNTHETWTFSNLLSVVIGWKMGHIQAMGYSLHFRWPGKVETSMVALRMHCWVTKPQTLALLVFLVNCTQFLHCLQEFLRSCWKFNENSLLVYENSFVVAENLTKIPYSSTRIPSSSTRNPSSSTRNPLSSTRVPSSSMRIPSSFTRNPSSFTNRAPRRQWSYLIEKSRMALIVSIIIWITIIADLAHLPIHHTSHCGFTYPLSVNVSLRFSGSNHCLLKFSTRLPLLVE